MFGGEVENRAAGDEDLYLGALQKVSHEWRGVENVLEVIEDNQQLLMAEKCPKRLLPGLS
jgi:hypothetical protein